VALALYPEAPLGAFSAPFLTVAIVAALQYLWRAPKARTRRQRLHDAGATMIHLGIVLMLLGYSGSTFFAQERTVNMSEGVPVHFEGYDLVLVDMSSDDEHVTLQIEVRMDGAVQAVADPGILIIQGQVRRDVSIVRFLDRDIYFVLEDLDKAVNTDAGARAQVTIKSLPAINALWCGAGLIMAGTAARFSWSPVPEPRPSEKKGKKPGPPTSEDE